MTITQLVREISPRLLHAAGRYRGRAIEWYQANSTTTDPVAKATKFVIKTVIGLYTRYIRDHCLQQRGFGVKLSNDVNQILRQLTLVAMATKLETK